MSVACASDSPLPISYETEHLRIGTNLAYPLCQGNLDSYERTIAFIESDLGVSLGQTIDVYIYSRADWEAGDAGECHTTPVNGCFNYRDLTIHTTTAALNHELAHAVVNNADLDIFFSEGIADVYAGLVSPFPNYAPSSFMDASWDNYDLWTAVHFVRWLREMWGGHKLGQLATLDRSGFVSFDDIYGMPLADAESMYFLEAPAVYPSLNGCDAPDILAEESEIGWRAKVHLDCGNNETHSALKGLFTHRTLVIAEDGLYSFATDGSWLEAYRCAEGPITDAPEEDREDIPPSYAAYPLGARRYFEGGDVHDVELKRGRYNFSIGIEGFEAASATLVVWPSVGPRPVERL